jgi:uncharacterized OB-fold protein
MPRVIPPSVETDDAYFWEGVAEHRLLLQECADCHTLRHPPLPMCGACHSTAWTTRESAGAGTVHSWIVARHPAAPTDEGRIVVLVQLDEGVRFVGNLVDTPVEAVANEMAVRLTFRDYDGVTLPQFLPADGPEADR